MSDITIEELRTLLRFIEPLRTLADNLEKNIQMDTFRGTSKLIAKNYKSIHETVTVIIDDAYVKSLELNVEADAIESEILAQVSTAVGQLLAYLESYTGVPSRGYYRMSVQTAPHITINASNASDDNVQRIMDMVRDAVNKNED